MFTSMVKNVNESLLARFMVDRGAFTKQEAARETGLSFPTVGKLVDSFVERNMVVPLGMDNTVPGGRKPMLYRINPDFAYGLVLFFDRTHFFCEIVNGVGEPVEAFTRPVMAEGYLATMGDILAQSLARRPNLISVSIGVQGGVADGRVLYIDGYDELVHCDLKGLLQEEFPVQVTVENNMRTVVCGLAETTGQMEEEAVVCLQVGENGPGCGILVHGAPLSGFAGLVGEVGYLPGWGGRNMQEIALSNFHDADVVDYFARLITGICVFFNPKQITIYENPYLGDMDELRLRCGHYLPQIALPQLVRSPHYERDFLAGLRKLAMDCFYPTYRVVQT